MSSDLTAEEQAELERQNLEAEHPRFHDALKCGPLEFRLVRKKVYHYHTELSRQYCKTHDVLVDMTGWEIGYAYGTESRTESPWIAFGRQGGRPRKINLT